MGSAKNTGTPARKDRTATMRRAERSRERRRRVIAVVAGAVVVVAAVGVGAWALTKDSGSSTDAKGGTKGDSKSASPKGAPKFTVGKDGVKSWDPDDLPRNHVTKTVHYPMTPPVGGDHNPVWMNCDGDVYKKAIPDMNAVHSLEHGAVWVTYTGKADPADVKKLQAKVSRTPYSLMSPLADQQDPIMLSAWGKQRTVKGADDPAVDAFFSDFVQGPQTPEPGAACTNGVSE